MEELESNGLLVLRRQQYDSHRLIFRELDAEDTEDVYEYGSSPFTCRFLKWGPYCSIEEAVKFIRQCHSPQSVQFGMILKHSNKLVGGIRIYNLDLKNRCVDISYILNEKFCGHGYMTESLRKMQEICFAELPVDRIYTYFVTENSRSEDVMKRCGMIMDSEYFSEAYIKGENRIVKRYYYQR